MQSAGMNNGAALNVHLCIEVACACGFESAAVLQMNLNRVTHCLSDVGYRKVLGMTLLGITIP